MFSSSMDLKNDEKPARRRSSQSRLMLNKEQSHMYVWPTSAKRSSVGAASTSAHQHRSPPHKHMAGPSGHSKTKTQTRWPLRAENTDYSNKSVHLVNQNNSTKNTRRRRSSSGLKALDSKLNNKGDVRPQRKCRSNEFYAGGGAAAAATAVRLIEITDSTDSARDSDTNLLIENMRNRESELFTKINSNNYYCCSSSENDDLVYLMKRQNGFVSGNESTVANSKRRKSPANKAARSNGKTVVVPQQLSILNQSIQTETRQSIVQYQASANDSGSRTVKFTITINRNSGIQTAGYQRVELNSEPLPIPSEPVVCERPVLVSSSPSVTVAPAEITDCSEECNSSSSVTEVGCFDLSSSLNDSRFERSGEYYDCASAKSPRETISVCSDSSNTSSNTTCNISGSSMSVYEDAIENHGAEPTQKQQQQKQQLPNEQSPRMPTISIEQELTANNEFRSTVHVDKKKVAMYPNKQVTQTLPTRSKSKRATVIGDNFCSEVFNSLEERNITLERSKQRKSDSCLNFRNERNSYLSDGVCSMTTSESVMSTRLQCVPKYTGTQIGRLLAKRLEKNEMLSERRKQLLNILALENMPAPVKPPRSFTSMSSPSSKQDSEGIVSATTMPIGEYYGSDAFNTCKEFFEPSFSDIHKQQEQEAKSQFGWVKTLGDTENKDNPQRTVFGWVGGKDLSNKFGWTEPTAPSAPQMPSSGAHAPSAPNILGMLNYETWQSPHSIQTTHLKPQQQQTGASPRENIDTVDSSAYFERFSTVSFPCSTPYTTPVKAKTPQTVPNLQQHAVPEPSNKTSNAVTKTKTLIGASKKFLKKPLQRKSPNKSSNTNPEVSSSVEKSKRSGDETAQYNSQDYSPNKQEKKSVKKLGFTPQRGVQIVGSPMRLRNKYDEKMVRSSPIAKQDTARGSTKQETGDFKRTAKVMVKLNKFAKSPRKLLRSLTLRKPNTDPGLKHNATYDEHFYKSFNGSTGKVPIMREILADLRHKVTGDVSQSYSAKRSLFHEECTSNEVLDQVSSQIADIDLHDEPEPLYAEVQFSGRSDGNQRPPVDVKEVFINGANESEPPRKYLMVNNDPSILYATVHNSRSSATSSSLDLHVINNFADSVENMVERRLRPETRAQTVNQRISTCSASLTDYYSGLDDFDFLNPRRPIPLSDITSIDTFGTEHLYETIISEHDMNDEICNDIHDLECSRATFDETSSDIDFDLPVQSLGAAFIEDLDESEEVAAESKSIDRDTIDFAMPMPIEAKVDYARGINTIPSPSPSKSLKHSPSYKEIKHKLHKSMRKGKAYLKQEGRKISELLENSLNKSDRKSAPTTPRKIRDCSQSSKYTDPKFVGTLDFSNARIQRMFDQLSQQLDVQNELREAIAFCRDTNEFNNSGELVEAERLGLISMMKESAAETELDLLCNADADDNCVEYSGDAKTCTVTINSIRFTLKADVLRDTQFNYFYVCICTHRGEVRCSVVRERQGNKVVFNDCKMVFDSLEPKFVINVEVHALCLRKSRSQNRTYDSPMRKDKRPHGENSEAADSILYTTAIQDSNSSDSDISMFKIMGSTVLTSYDLCHRATLSQSTAKNHLFSTKEVRPFEFTMMTDRNHLMHAIDIDFRTDINFIVARVTGFVNIADCNSNWNRRWCSIDEFFLNFWNYPQDSAMPPTSTISLKNSACENEIVAANREVCAKPRSFVIDIYEENNPINGERKTQRYYISTDTAAELKSWLADINRVINFIRDWHIV